MTHDPAASRFLGLTMLLTLVVLVSVGYLMSR
jgi:hypothetical protein